ncbi:MAG: hypothetical protein WCS72_17615 [Deltaproteobacteria bacterium]
MIPFTHRALLLAVALSAPAAASAYSHANRYGGTTSHSEGSTTATGAYGSSATHTAGQGTTASGAYGGSMSHAEGSGQTTATNAHGGSATHTYGEGTTVSSPYYHTTATAYHAPYPYPPPPPPPVYYHPPTTVAYYPASGCYNCAATGAVAAGVVVGAAVATSTAYSQPGPGQPSYVMGASYATLPPGCITPTVGGVTYYQCGYTWFKPAYGANGVHYTVVPPQQP